MYSFHQLTFVFTMETLDSCIKVKMSGRIENYQFETLLGKGTFGSVYLVRRKKDYKLFVIKTHHEDNNYSNNLFSKLILEEIKCLQKMKHPNIIAYQGAWIENDNTYIVMEYATRGTLKDLLETRKSPLKSEDALYLFSQIILGVHHIQSKKVLHRDLKPENIMLTGHRGDIIKIGDFGVSKHLDGESVMSCAGSFNYMAPEMLKGQPYDFKCDIWSMGVVLYEMITKRLPFVNHNLDDIIEIICNEKPEPLDSQVPENIVNLISKMLRKQASGRPTIKQLITCPYLIPSLILVYLNAGRCPNLDESNVQLNMFLKFITP